MSREKQIEEMANILWHIPNNYFLNSYNDCERIAECIYDDGGYRKKSDVAKEIFDAIKEKLIFNTYGIATISNKTFCELKKKYTGEKETGEKEDEQVH